MDKELLNNLSTAVSNGRTDIVRSLLSMCENGSAISNGTNISANEVLNEICNPVGTLLHLATKLDHVDIVRTILSSGAQANIENSFGESPFDLVQSQRMTTVYVEELLKCSAKSELDRIRQLISAGVDVNSTDSPESKNTALHWAVCFGKPEAVQCLLDLGASPNVMNGQGMTPLHDAVKRKNVEIIKLLLAAGADPLFKPSLGKYMDKSPMDIAEGNEEISQLFLEYIPKDTESENSNDENDTQSDQLSKSNLDNLSSSLQSLSTISEPSLKNMSTYTPQSSVHVPPFLLTPLPLITDSKLHLLWPQPQKIVQIDEEFFRLQPKYSVQIIHSSNDISALAVADVWNIHSDKFTSLGYECCIENIMTSNFECSGDIICHLSPQTFSRLESYKLVISKDQMRIIASDLYGLHNALCTLEQLFSLYDEDGSVPSLFIHDWPQLQHRAVLLDFAYGARKPTLETLKEYIKTMSSLKLNQLHCYFRYEQSTGNSIPFSNKEFIELSRFCSQHFVNLIPAIDVGANEKYINVKDSITEPAHQLMSLFCSKSIQIGPNLSKIILQQMLSSKNSRIIWDMLLLPTSTVVYLCYNSVLQQSCDLLKLLPLNCILIDYEYQVEHDYDLNAKIITHSGLNVCIGTGTAAWGSIAGSPEIAISCIHKASLAATLHGSFGMIIADWQTLPHHPAFCFSWPGILLGLGAAWNSSVHEDYLHSRLPELLNFYVYQDTAQITGYLNIELGRLEAFMHQSIFQNYKDPSLNTSCKNSILHQLLVDADAVLLDNFTFDLLQQVIRHVRKFELELQKAKPSCFHHGEIILELRLAMDLLLFACRLSKVMVTTGLNPTSNSCGLAVINVGISNLPPIARTDLANRLLALIEQFRAVWLSRNLPCGLHISLTMFNTLLTKLIPENDASLNSVDRNSQLLQDLYSSTEIVRKSSFTA
ncbi:glyco_hydro_20b domain-containing protein [Trichonephila clavata]|uniref:Glyco_hydro_20b domain-containing protein n=1 Tax=Trichonephila clavata TaxID=2740835 RepID=A0A8X6HPM1_TRICU|nr:glyco_hydro_20b domain-containing protein [Trichonephila clavata]